MEFRINKGDRLIIHGTLAQRREVAEFLKQEFGGMRSPGDVSAVNDYYMRLSWYNMDRNARFTNGSREDYFDIHSMCLRSSYASGGYVAVEYDDITIKCEMPANIFEKLNELL